MSRARAEARASQGRVSDPCLAQTSTRQRGCECSWHGAEADLGQGNSLLCFVRVQAGMISVASGMRGGNEALGAV